ncbi:MAG TPA: iron-sulfur cluster assembly protein [Bacteroidales bacterium]|nr:iron-sulfur cluster assembly protein [Bacteroidales bacterium]HOH22332.1 iron-sulfur cluster assembly protein [Bacteroidales bacterium]HPB57015.1 iron-sulfur cluster assembly protein [Bacteroidales bacterium]HPZ03265.1 iron-sulfur cluster assembly protein [Bacteroidales bacterium]HQB74648.1 iron-sulfur cluster assembly protein [Bacteroidales bacterium]
MREQIIIQLSTVFDPEIPVNVWELGLIYDIRVQSNNDVEIVMTLTAPNCPEAGLLPYQIEQAVKRVPDVGNVDVKITFEPPWNMDKMSEAAKLELGFL